MEEHRNRLRVNVLYTGVVREGIYLFNLLQIMKIN